jgi:hypothetical protein
VWKIDAVITMRASATARTYALEAHAARPSRLVCSPR